MVRSWLLVVCALAGVAHADDAADDLKRRGEQLAKDGDFAQAIDLFKSADAQHPTTELACLIGLAYGRRNLYGQAELFFDDCHERAETGEPVPSWVGKVEDQFRERLASSKLARVKIVVKHGRKPKVVVSAFAPDEAFAPRVIHLPIGRHTITATDADHDSVERTVVVEDGEPQTVVIDLGGKPVLESRPSPDHVGRNIAFVGLGVVAVGAIVHATWYRNERDTLANAQNNFDYDAHVDDYTNARYVTVGLYAAGGITALIGLVLHVTRAPESGPSVSLVPARGGGVLAVEWSR
jgi:hypothetical protein